LLRDIQRVLFSEETILGGIERVAAEITRVYAGNEFTVVSVLKGSCIFVADLIRRIPTPLRLAFVAASSYDNGTDPGTLDLSFFPTGPEIRGQELLLVDDILDSGRTLSCVAAQLLDRGAARVRTCTFLDKPSRRRVPFQPDFRVFEIEDIFVVGYGLDFAGRYRNLPYVGALRLEILTAPVDGAGSR
jgi:hypoxanthine phosphoribosyltransferase